MTVRWLRITIAVLLLGGIAALGAPRVVSADGHDGWRLAVSPDHGDCSDEVLTFSGDGFPAGATVAIIRFRGFDIIELDRLQADAAGSFVVEHEDLLTGEFCGAVFHARIVLDDPESTFPYRDGQVVTTYTQDRPQSIVLDPPVGPCRGDITARGTGWLPNEPILLLHSSISPLAGEAAEIGRATTTAAGTFETTVRVLFAPNCEAGSQAAVRAGIWRPDGSTPEGLAALGASAIYTAGAVQAPAAGGAGLASTDNRGAPTPLAAATALLAVLLGAATLRSLAVRER
ncbi:MAG: hypothetical protein V3R95_09375 [Dehalococcoidia bacterium]